MGYHSLLAFSHDMFDRVEKDPQIMTYLRHYMNSGGSEAAEELARHTGHAVTVVSMRHSTNNFYVSNKVPGFPVKLPYEEELDQEIKDWEAAETKAKAWLGGTIKLRTISQLKDLIVRLMRKTKVADAQIAAGTGAYMARRKLSDTSWKPTRADYESLKNRLAEVEQLLGEDA